MDDFWYRLFLEKTRSDKVSIMSKKLQELNGLSAEQILELYAEKTLPIDIEKILKKLGVKYDSMDFSDIEKSFPEVIKQRGKILGVVTIIDDDVNIFYSASDSTEHRKKFTLAHELAHCCLNAEALGNKGHIEFRFDANSNSSFEHAANVFAGKLLMPTDILVPMYKEMIVPLSDVLAQKFCVSVNVMEARLEYLGLPFYSPNLN